MKTLQEELGLPKPIAYPGHDTLMSIMLTGTLLGKEGDRLLRPFGLTDTQLNVLMLLKAQNDPPITQTRLGEMMLVNRSNITGLIDRMEQAGWVRRRAEPGDRRIKHLELTEAGNRLIGEVERVYFERVDQVVGRLTPKEQEQLRVSLSKVREAIRETLPSQP